MKIVVEKIYRLEELERINKENQRLLNRLAVNEPIYNTLVFEKQSFQTNCSCGQLFFKFEVLISKNTDWARDYQKSCAYGNKISRFPKESKTKSIERKLKRDKAAKIGEEGSTTETLFNKVSIIF